MFKVVDTFQRLVNKLRHVKLWQGNSDEAIVYSDNRDLTHARAVIPQTQKLA